MKRRHTAAWSIRRKRSGDRSQRGIITVLAAVLLVAVFAFVAFAVDTGLISLARTNMQNAVDAASLAASQEISGAVMEAGETGGDATVDANSIAVANARAMAFRVAAANGVTIDPQADVIFGKRTFNAATGTWPIDWGTEPFNVVKVTARRDNPDTAQATGEVKLSFGWAVGQESVPITTSAAAFVEARDIVLVLDFSSSMNDDSSIRSFSTLGQANVEASLDLIWNRLVEENPTWPGTSESKFPAEGYGELNSRRGKYISSNNTATIYSYLELNDQVNGLPKYPFPQAGRSSNGLPRKRPSYKTSRNLWYGYIDYVRNLKGPYRKRYGYRTLMNYLQDNRFKSDQSEDLWRTPHYPFHAVKEGASLFLDFLGELNFGDEVGLVSYGGYSKIELELNDGDAYVNVANDPITGVYSDIDTIQRHKQAGHYDGWTGMGYGIRDARQLLIGNPSNPADHGQARFGARPTMIVMTDGQTNQGPSDFRMPAGWDWSQWTDYDGDGSPDYTTSSSKKQYAFWEAAEAIRGGVTVHTMSVGAGADRGLMRAIAFAGNGIWVDVPGGSTVADMEAQMLEAFRKIAAKVPAAKLVYAD